MAGKLLASEYEHSNDMEDLNSKAELNDECSDISQLIGSSPLPTLTSLTPSNLTSFTPSPSKPLPKSEHFARLGSYAELLWQDNLMSDVRLKVQEYTFNAHKAVLACYSPYLKKKLDQNQDTEMLVLTGVKANVLRTLLDYMYTGELKLNCQTFTDLFYGAKKLQMKDVVELCYEKLSKMNTKSFIYLYVSTGKLGMQEKWNKAYDLVLENFEECMRTEEFLDLSCDHVCELLSADKIGVRSEIVIFLAALKWLCHKQENRNKHAVRVFSCVRFPQMGSKEVLYCFKPPMGEDLVRKKEIKTMLHNALVYTTAVNQGIEKYFKEYNCKQRDHTLDGQISSLWDIHSTGEGDN